MRVWDSASVWATAGRRCDSWRRAGRDQAVTKNAHEGESDLRAFAQDGLECGLVDLEGPKRRSRDEGGSTGPTRNEGHFSDEIAFATECELLALRAHDLYFPLDNEIHRVPGFATLREDLPLGEDVLLG